MKEVIPEITTIACFYLSVGLFRSALFLEETGWRKFFSIFFWIVVIWFKDGKERN